MNETTLPVVGEQGNIVTDPDLDQLSRMIDHVADVLPTQGPITVFIAQNILQAFEHHPFDEGMKRAATVLGCQPYLSEDRYREELGRARIRFSDLKVVLAQDLGGRASEQVAGWGTRLDLRLAMLEYPTKTGPTAELLWYVAETDALRKVRSDASSTARARLIAETRRWVMRDLRGWTETGPDGVRKQRVGNGLGELLDRFGESSIENWADERWEEFTLQALWKICRSGVRDLPQFTSPPPMFIRHRDLLHEATGADSDRLVHGILIRFCSAFLDQGLARWPLPRRDEGFFKSFCSLYGQPGGMPALWMRGLAAELRRLESEEVNPLASIRDSLEQLGVQPEEREAFLSATFLALRGWAGMVRQVEIRGDRAVKPVPPGSLVEFLAIRLLLDRFALKFKAHELIDFNGPLAELRSITRVLIKPHWPPSDEQRAFQLFQIAQIMGLSPDLLYRLDRAQWIDLMREIETFSGLERRRIFHLGYEKHFRTRALDAITLHSPLEKIPTAPPRFQVVFCLDEREESFRRHLEEIAPDVETLGVAGFFNLAMYYKGMADAHFTPLCPVVIRPQHWVLEEPGIALDKASRFRAKTRRMIGTASHQFHLGSRSVALGALLTGAVGVFASFPLVARILFPRVTARIRSSLGRFVRTPPITHLHLERTTLTPGKEGKSTGFNLDEMTSIGQRLLSDMGLTKSFARLVIILGHGSNSQNNPYNSAYNCGACGGGAGGPNARAVAQILNDNRVRANLAKRGLLIPEDTVFVSGCHNTCNDTIEYSDLDRIRDSHRPDFSKARANLEAACERNAHERCRRFMSAPLTLSFSEALEHVEERAEDLAQTRPELGHATNAITIVGRRSWSRGLFLDRRAFLASYDPTQDDENSTILAGILSAVFPVCSGINFTYNFSNVDNIVLGSGTKLPHNLAALVGVMDGAASDLRTGLPWQMVEVHEPLRSLFIIETTADRMFTIMDRNAGISQLCRNRWIQLALIHPETRALTLFGDNGFVPHEAVATVLPQASSSAEWYRGWREHLEFAQIVPVNQVTT